MIGLARRLGCTEGQAYTAVIGFVVGLVLLLVGMPPALRDRPLVAADAGPPRASTSTTTTDVGTDPGAGAGDPPFSVWPGTPTPGTSPAPTPEFPDAPPSAEVVVALSVIDAGYTSLVGGTPLSGPEVPDDGMPVGVRLGQVDKMSFARLAGNGSALRLRLVDDPLANQLVALAAVRACVVTQPGWVIRTPGAPPSEAPTFDTRRCTPGVAAPDGTWRFELGGLGRIDPTAGIAFLPVVEGAATFQLTFSVVALPEVGR